MEKRDTHGWVCPKGDNTYTNLFINGHRKSEAAKFSNKKNIIVKDFELISGFEDCIDIVRGDNITFERGVLHTVGKQGVTAKGGVSNVTFKNVKFMGTPKIAHVVAGQYCDYDLCGIPKTRNITFIDCTFDEGRPSIQLWNAEGVNVHNCTNFTTHNVNRIIVLAYYTFRKIQQRIRYGKNGRGDACLRV